MALVLIYSYQNWGLCVAKVHLRTSAVECFAAEGVPEVDRSGGFRSKDGVQGTLPSRCIPRRVGAHVGL